MDAYRAAFRAIGLVIGCWALLASLFFSCTLIFHVDAWQIFGNLMLPIIIVLALNLIACLSWIYGMIIFKTRYMLAALVYWIIPMIYCIRFIWMPIRHNSINGGQNMHYFNTEEDDLTVRFEMTMTKPYLLTIYSALFVVFFIVSVVCYLCMLATRPSGIVDDPRFNVQSHYMVPSVNIHKQEMMKKEIHNSGQDLQIP